MILTAIKRASSFKQLLALFDGASDQGRASFVVTAKGDEVETAFKLVEAVQLIPSNTPDGKINPAFPEELQPRDRTRQASVMQISKMANNLRPAQLTDSGLSSHGAPIVGPDLVVESGNGRTMAILKAYSSGKGEEYRQFLVDNAKRFGFKSATVQSMTSPVLVRERLTDMDRATFARDSNLSDLQQMSAAETAWVDAEVMDDKMMAQFEPSESGSLLARSNQPFVQSFMRALGDTSAAGLVTADGRPTRQLLDRMQNAIFAKAYKNDRLVKLVAEEPDPEIRNVLNALNGAAAQFVEMQYLDGQIHKQTTSDLVDAIDTIEQAPPVFTIPPEQLEMARTELESKRDASSGSLRSVDRKYALSIIRDAVEDDRGNHPYSNIRGLADVAVYHNKQYPDLPIVVSTKVMKDLAAHAISPEKVVALSKLNEILPTMRFTGKRYDTNHNEQKHSSVKYWEDAIVNLKVGDKTFEIGVKTRCIENGVKGDDSLSPYSLWDKDLMVESLASARGGISQGEPESRISQQSHQPPPNNIQLDHGLIKYLDVSDLTITEKRGEPTLAESALDSLVRATELVREAKDTGQDVDELLAQAGLFGDNDPEAEALARFIATNNRSAKRMAEAFKELATVINEQLRKAGSAIGDMFGGGKVTLIEVLAQVGQRLEEQSSGQSGFMFESAKIDKLANRAATSLKNDLPEPSQEQLESGNYATGSLKFAGLPIEVENPKGSDRKGTDANGTKWTTRMNHHYGFIANSQGADGDEIDVFLGENESPKYVYIINQVETETGEFDEHKVMLGFHSPTEAKRAYLSNYSDDWAGLGTVVSMRLADFQEWVYSPLSVLPAKRSAL